MARARRRIAPRRILRVAYRVFVFTRSGSSDWIHIFAKNMHIEKERDRNSLVSLLLRSHVASTVYFLCAGHAVSISERCVRVYNAIKYFCNNKTKTNKSLSAKLLQLVTVS